MASITTKQGNEYQLDTFNGSVYVRTNKGAYKVDAFDYVSGKVDLAGCNDEFILNGEVYKVILAREIDRATYGEWVDGYFPEPFKILHR